MKRTKLLAKKGFRKPTLEEVKARKALQRPKNRPKLHLKRGSMVKPIPLKMREELAEEPFMKKCCLLHFKAVDECKGDIQWHHNLIYAGKRINEYGAILPVCEYHHRKESSYKFQLDFIMNLRMSDQAKSKYPKKKWL